MIRFSTFGRDDYATLISWIDSEETLMQFGGPLLNFPLTPSQLDILVSDPQKIAHNIVMMDTGRCVGHAEIHFSENSAKLARILIGDPLQRGKGLGRQVVELLLEEAFSRPGVGFVELNVFDFNTPAIKCYEKVGFVIDPSKKLERKVKGVTWTALNMTIGKAQWQPT